MPIIFSRTIIQKMALSALELRVYILDILESKQFGHGPKKTRGSLPPRIQRVLCNQNPLGLLKLLGF